MRRKAPRGREVLGEPAVPMPGVPPPPAVSTVQAVLFTVASTVLWEAGPEGVKGPALMRALTSHAAAVAGGGGGRWRVGGRRAVRAEQGRAG